jgi:hypothetical protein
MQIIGCSSKPSPNSLPDLGKFKYLSVKRMHTYWLIILLNYIGVDCADVLMAALALEGRDLNYRL